MLTPEEARLLSHLVLGAAPATRGAGAALRRARAHGPGLEFHEYRHYEAGDDPRSIDWTVEARLRQLVVRVARADGHVTLHTLIDASASMAIGRPDKFICARKIAAALCYVALERRDAAGLATFDTDVRTYVAPATGRHQLFRALAVLGEQSPSGASAPDDALMRYGAVARGAGLAVVISDFLSPAPGFAGLEFLLHQGLAPAVVQVLAPEEIDPPFDDAELTDVEDPRAAPLSVGRAAVASYRTRLAEHNARLRDFCRDRGLPYVRVESTLPYDALLTRLENAGLFSAR